MQELYDHTGDDGTDLDKFPLGHVNLAATGRNSSAGEQGIRTQMAATLARPCTLEYPFVWRKGVLNGY